METVFGPCYKGKPLCIKVFIDYVLTTLREILISDLQHRPLFVIQVLLAISGVVWIFSDPIYLIYLGFYTSFK